MTEDFLAHSGALFTAYGAYVIGVASPGPANLAIASTSVSQGRRNGLLLAMGVILGSAIWGIVAAFGLSATLMTLGWAFTALKIVGGIYLLWLAVNSFRSSLRSDSMPMPQPSEKTRNYFLRGLLIHLTNPKAVFVWLAIIALGLKPDSPLWMTFAILIGCEILGLLIFGGYALLFSTNTAIRAYARLRRGLEAFMALAFGIAGIKLLAARL